MNAINALDWIAFWLWLGLWSTYQWYVTRSGKSRPSLGELMVPMRRQWMLEALHRDNRISDVAMIGNLMHSSTFFSSTTLLILGGLFAFISSIDHSVAFVQNLPFARRTSVEVIEVKAVVLAGVFIYALFRFLWSIRQFNLLNIMLGAYPPAHLRSQPTPRAAGYIVEQAAKLNALAGNNFAQALRAYYYSVPILLWLVNPWLMIVGTIIVTAAVFFTEFRSETVQSLLGDDSAAPTATSDTGSNPRDTPSR